MAGAGGFAGILLGTEEAPRADKEIDKKKADGNYELKEAERKEKIRLRQANCWVQRRHPEQTKRLIKRKLMAIMN